MTTDQVEVTSDGKHETPARCWLNVVLPSQMVVQYSDNNASMFRDCRTSRWFWGLSVFNTLCQHRTKILLGISVLDLMSYKLLGLRSVLIENDNQF